MKLKLESRRDSPSVVRALPNHKIQLASGEAILVGPPARVTTQTPVLRAAKIWILPSLFLLRNTGKLGKNVPIHHHSGNSAHAIVRVVVIPAV
jgi:hypothetical protein